MKIRSTIMTALVVFGSVAGISSVQAAEGNEFATKTVSYADLNLDSDAGAHVFYNRVQSAAKSVCSAYQGRDRNSAAQYEGCFDKAVSTAVAQANNSKVTALYTHSKSTSVRLVASR